MADDLLTSIVHEMRVRLERYDLDETQRERLTWALAALSDVDAGTRSRRLRAPGAKRSARTKRGASDAVGMSRAGDDRRRPSRPALALVRSEAR